MKTTKREPKIEWGSAIFPLQDDSTYEELTKEEESAIRALNRVARKWPKSLWLFSGSGTLHVMKKYQGRKAMIESCKTGEGVHPGFSVASIRIENDGGDW